jgi:hypothetical protein
MENIIIENNMNTTKKRDIKVYDTLTKRSISIATANKRFNGNNKDRFKPNTKEVGFNPKLEKFVLSNRFKKKIEKKANKIKGEEQTAVRGKSIVKKKPTAEEKAFGVRTYTIDYNPNKFGKQRKYKNKANVIDDFSSIMADIDAFIKARIKKPNGLARVIMISPNGISGKNTFSTRISEDPSMEEILEQLMRVLNSYEEFDLSQAIFIVKFYDIPQGGASVKCPKWLLEKKKSVFIIENDDDYCGHRCLVLGIANKNRQQYLRTNKKLLETEAGNMALRLNKMGKLNFLDFEDFVIEYPEYRVNIVGDMNTILYETANTDFKEDLWIYYDNKQEHFHYIMNIQGFFNNKTGHYKFCFACRKRLEYRVFDKHKCEGLKCNLCHTVFKDEKEKAQHMSCKGQSKPCGVCNLKCRGEECRRLHEEGNGKRKGCKSKMWFFDCCLKEGHSPSKCWGRQEDKEVHICDHAFCNTCNEYKPREHRCWIKPREQKDKGLTSLIAFDFESFIDEETGEHLVNYIVAKERGTNKRWIWEWSEGKDILKEFIDFVFTKPQTTFIAHNGKSYDTWLIHYHICKHYNQRPNKIILAGQKIMYMEINSVKFIDSLNHFACKLEAVPKTFGLNEDNYKKGFYPYTFNTKNNWDYEGEMPPIKDFNPCGMDIHKRLEFLKWWYEKKEDNYIWRHAQETKEYCISDTDILLEGCNVYSQEGYDITGIDPLSKKTIAGWVMDIYLKRFYNFDLTPICVLYKDEYDFMRRGFHGGRTETFRLYRKWNKQELKEGKCGRYLDIQSLYPTTQYYDDFPVGEPSWIKPNDIVDNHEYINNNFGWYEVDITMNTELYIPPLVAKGEGKLTADLLDKQKQVFHAVELREAIKSGCIITKIHNGIIMNTTTNLFKDFVGTFLEVKVNATGKPKFWDNKVKRDSWIKEHEDRFNFTPNPTENNAGKRAIAKMILNSLWGKFGQRPDMPKNIYIPADKIYKWWKMLKDCKDGKIDIKNDELSGDCMYVCYKELDDKNNDILKATSIAIASSTTANATMRLYAELKKLDKRVLYCDTDSIIYEHDPDKYNIPEGKYLGEWECETDGKPITEFVSTGAKSYAYKVEHKVKDTKMKGITLNWENSKDINFNTLKSLVMNEKEKLITKQNLRFIKDKKEGIRTTTMKKGITFTMDKRAVEGVATYPFGYTGEKLNITYN